MNENTPIELQYQRNSIYEAPEHLHPYVKCCLEIATRAHGGMLRDKSNDVKLPYITHPIATLNLLLHAGERDPVLLSAALLHDVLEDCASYLANEAARLALDDVPPYADTLQELLHDAFEAQAKQGRMSIAPERYLGDAGRIVSIVQELSALPNLGMSKRISRSLGAMNYGQAAAKIKIAELAASLADDIINPPLKGGDARLAYNDYVWSVAKSAMHVTDSQPKQSRDPQVAKLFKLVRHLREENRALLDFPRETLSKEEKQAKQTEFSLELNWLRAQKLPNYPKAQPADLYIEHLEMEEKEDGITKVGLTKDGLVTRIGVWVDLEAGRRDKRFASIDRLTKMIEFNDPENAVSYGHVPKIAEPGKLELKLKLVKPITIGHFIDYACASNALNRESQHDQWFIDSLPLISAAFKDPHNKEAWGRWADKIKKQLDEPAQAQSRS